MTWKALQHRHFARLFVASLISEVGSKIHRIALLVYVYTLTNEALWVSLTLAVQLIASIAAGPLLSAWADTQERRRLLVGSDLLRMVLVLLIPLIGFRSLPMLLVLTFLIEVLRTLHDPVAAAIIPDVLPEDTMDAANGLMLFAQRFAEVAFVGVAGALVALIGAEPAFWVDAFTYLASALLLLRLPRLEPSNSQQIAYWTRVRQGLSHIFGHPTIRYTIGTLFTAAMFGSVETALGLILAVSFLYAGAAGFGVMEAAMALGAVLGTLCVPQLTTRIRREQLFLWGLLVFGLLIASIGVFPVFAWVVVAYLLTGIVNMAFIVPLRSILQLNTPPELRTRTFTAVGAIANSAVLAGTLLCGFLEQPLGAPSVFFIAGLMVTLVALLVLLRGGIPTAGAAQALPPTAEASQAA